MMILVLLVLFVMVALLLFDRPVLREETRTTRWFVYGIYAMGAGLWLMMYWKTDHAHLISKLEPLLQPLVLIK